MTKAGHWIFIREGRAGLMMRKSGELLRCCFYLPCMYGVWFSYCAENGCGNSQERELPQFLLLPVAVVPPSMDCPSGSSPPPSERCFYD